MDTVMVMPRNPPPRHSEMEDDGRTGPLRGLAVVPTSGTYTTSWSCELGREAGRDTGHIHSSRPAARLRWAAWTYLVHMQSI
jgi:hypothetical protein